MTQRIPGGGSDLIPTDDLVGGSSVFVHRKPKRRAKPAAKKPQRKAATANQNNLSRGSATSPQLVPPPLEPAAGDDCAPATVVTTSTNVTVERPGCETAPVKIVILKKPGKS
jgi:hypothetical protein